MSTCDPGIPSVLSLVVAACQYRLRAGPPVRVSADCVKGGEGRGVGFAKQQRRGVSHKLTVHGLVTAWSPCRLSTLAHTHPPFGHCVSHLEHTCWPFLSNYVFFLLKSFVSLILLYHHWDKNNGTPYLSCLSFLLFLYPIRS